MFTPKACATSQHAAALPSRPAPATLAEETTITGPALATKPTPGPTLEQLPPQDAGTGVVSSVVVPPSAAASYGAASASLGNASDRPTSPLAPMTTPSDGTAVAATVCSSYNTAPTSASHATSATSIGPIATSFALASGTSGGTAHGTTSRVTIGGSVSGVPSAQEQREWELRALRYNGGSIAPVTAASGAPNGGGKKRKGAPSSNEKNPPVTGQKQLLAFFVRKE